MAEWLRRDQANDLLYREIMLMEAQAWMKRNNASRDESAFVEASQQREDQEAIAERQRQEEMLALRDQALQRLRLAVGLAVPYTIVGTLALFTLVIFIGAQLFLAKFDLTIGNIPRSNILAPQDLTYTSDILTNRAREAARDAVVPIYDPPDLTISNVQTALARQILDFITAIRDDPYATAGQKAEALAAIEDIRLSTQTTLTVLNLYEDRWQSMEDEVINVLVTALHREIRPDRVEAARTQIPLQVSVRFSEQDSDAISDIVDDLIAANTFQNDDATAAARLAAAEAVAPISRSFAKGQIVVPAGQRIDEMALEAIVNLNAVSTVVDTGRVYLFSVLIDGTIVLFILTILNRFFPQYVKRRILFAALGSMSLLFIGGLVYFSLHPSV